VELFILGLVLVASLFLIPLGLPGIWVIAGAALVYNYLVGAERVGTVTVVGVFLLAVAAEVIEFVLGGRFARRYGGSRRAGWGAIIGGIIGAIVGVPVPIVGPMLGAFAGSFLGALAFEYSRRGAGGGHATRVATGALLGRVAAVAVKSAIGCVMVAWVLLAAWS
jgi:uncharacterized protein YqgC (DUF456 family)